ncbi:MAG TPA: Ppx/GppA phosphatase family protein [Nocardioidaceae bacterium]|nr:Ppx/GppA phosphatase family protein [Nocardioidaceae bacterium]
MTRVAAFDCGTNTIKMLIADLSAATGEELEQVRDMRMVRLGQDVDSTGRLADEALFRVFAAIDEFKVLVDEYDPQAMRFCATSAVRDASNADVFIDGVIKRLGVPPEVLSGDEEARLSYVGATRALPDRKEPTLVIDIGGGSTELIMGKKHRSLDIGAVRLTERFLKSDPPKAGEIENAATFIDAQLETLVADGIFLDLARSVVGVAGTITTMAAMALDLPAYDREAINHSTIERDDVRELMVRLIEMTVAERKTLPFLHPGRADVIAAGALILDRIMVRTDVDSLLVSESDILDGIAWSIA